MLVLSTRSHNPWVSLNLGKREEVIAQARDTPGECNLST